MVSAKAMVYGNAKTFELLKTDVNEKPCSVQIFGSDPNSMAQAAQMLNDSSFDVVDINMGCPAPKIVRNGDGSALMKDPKLVYSVVTEVVKASSKPITAKIRLGYSYEDRNYLEIAKAIEAAGAAAITVHGRTRPQMYSGEADWEAIAKVKKLINIPIIGNGDIDSPEIARKRIDESGVDAVMIGRAALGNPWLFERCEHYLQTGEILAEPSPNEKVNAALDHANGLIAEKGEYIGVMESRKHIAWYIKGIKGATETRVLINRCDNIEQINNILQRLLKSLIDNCN